MPAYSKLINAFKKYPFLRGVASYGVLWPISSLIQQTFEGKTIDDFDYARSARYGVYGSMFVAPTFYCWITVANVMWPGNSIKTAIIKTAVESVTYSPLSMCCFFFFMSLLESKPFHEAGAEVKAKLWPTYKVAVLVWPAIAMFNFCVVPPRNRVPFISFCSCIWTCYLAYMKNIEKEKVATRGNSIQLLKMS